MQASASEQFERLLGSIDRPYEVLAAIADVCEEVGNNGLAAGYRLLYQHKRWPNKKAACWYWTLARSWKDKKAVYRLPDDFPIVDYRASSASNAIRFAAAAAQRWLEGVKFYKYGEQGRYYLDEGGNIHYAGRIILDQERPLTGVSDEQSVPRPFIVFIADGRGNDSMVAQGFLSELAASSFIRQEALLQHKLVSRL